jgi:hypothetical protein
VTGAVGYVSLGSGVVLGILVVNAVNSLVSPGEYRNKVVHRHGYEDSDFSGIAS